MLLRAARSASLEPMYAKGMPAAGSNGADSRPIGTASAAVLRPVVNFAHSTGVDVVPVLRAVGLTLAGLDNYDVRIPEASRFRVWTELAARSGDPLFGLHLASEYMATSSSIGAFDVLDYSLYFSSTLGDALARFTRFSRVLSDAWALKGTIDAKLARFRRIERTPAPEADAFFGFFAVRARLLTGTDVTPREVSFAHSTPDDKAPYAALFRCPVRFGAPASEIVFDAKDLALPVSTANAGVEAILERYMTEMLERLPRNESFVERVRTVVARKLCEGPPTLAKTARELHSSPRTVQRRLGAYGTRYTDVVDFVRRELGLRLVAEGRLSITEIAFLLGFDEVSGFRSVYKRWTGTAPSRARLNELSG